MGKKERAMGFINEFRIFMLRGNVVDLAVGVIIGGAFKTIVDSLVADVMMPLLGLVLGKLDFNGRYIEVGGSKIMYGSFVTSVINFVLMAFVIFMLIKIINKIRSPGAPEPTVPETKKCDYCCSKIPLQAVKCPNCTSDLPEETEEGGEKECNP